MKEPKNPCLTCPKYGRLPYYSNEEYGCTATLQVCQKFMDYQEALGDIFRIEREK